MVENIAEVEKDKEINIYVLNGASVESFEYLMPKKIDDNEIQNLQEKGGIKVVIAPEGHDIWSKTDLILFKLVYNNVYIILDELFNKTAKLANDFNSFTELLLLNISRVYSLYELYIIEKAIDNITKSIEKDVEVYANEVITVRSADIEETFGNLKFKVKNSQAHLMYRYDKPYIILLLRIMDKNNNLIDTAIIEIELPKNIDEEKLDLEGFIRDVLKSIWEEIILKYQANEEPEFESGEFEIRGVGSIKVRDISRDINKSFFIIVEEIGQRITSRETIKKLIENNELEGKLLFLI